MNLQRHKDTQTPSMQGPALHLRLLAVLLIIGFPSSLVTMLERVLSDHLQTLPLLPLLRVPLGELGLYLARVDVGVEIGHHGEDDAHDEEQGGEEDVLGPLRNKHTEG